MKPLSIDRIHDILYDILCDVDDFCRREGIRYCIGYGTLLGAVRYGNFIPWDDDVDIVMPRKDFDRFVKTYRGKYECILNTRRKDVFYVSGYAKVHDCTTSKFIGRENQYYSRYGVSVDIFPYDPVPDGDMACEAHMKKAGHYHRRLRYCSSRTGSPLILLQSRLHSMDWWLRKCDKVARSFREEDCGRIGVLMGPESARDIQSKDFFLRLKEIKLRDRMFPCPGNVDAYLTQRYGPDYIVPPPEKERTGHGCKVYQIS